MGLFDYIRFRYPLPIHGANEFEYQTKDFDWPFMERYEVHEDGSLWGEDYDIEDRSDPNATGLMRLIGSVTRVNVRPRREHLTDYITFGTGPAGSWDWLEFRAHFVDGVVQSVAVVEARPRKCLEG